MGFGPDAEIVFNGPFTQAGGYEMAKQALALSPRPTAFLAANNFIAVGAYQAVREAGLSVPEDMSIVGFDDLPTWLVMEPFLTVAAQPAYEMGQRATQILLERLGHEARRNAGRSCCPSRSSCAGRAARRGRIPPRTSPALSAVR